MRLVVALLVVGLSGCDRIPGTAAYEMRNRVEYAVRRNLKDPSSAQFSDVEYFPGRDIACGKVNAKNEFGGYVGAFEFAYHEGSAHSLNWGNDPNRFLWVRHECLREHVQKLRNDNPGTHFDDVGPFKPV